MTPGLELPVDVTDELAGLDPLTDDEQGLEGPGPPPDEIEIGIERNVGPAGGDDDVKPEFVQEFDVLPIEVDTTQDFEIFYASEKTHTP